MDGDNTQDGFGTFAMDMRGLMDKADGAEETDIAIWGKVEGLLEDTPETKVIKKLSKRLREMQETQQAMLEENARVLSQLKRVQAAFERMKELASKQGLGEEVMALAAASGLNDYLCRQVFVRLYRDAIQRRARFEERKRVHEEKRRADFEQMRLDLESPNFGTRRIVSAQPLRHQ